MSPSKPGPQPAAARRAAEAELLLLIAKFASAHQRLVSTSRRWLRKRLPTAHEVIYEYRDCFVISFSPSEHGYEGVCSLRGSEAGVRLYFNSAKRLPDPEKLLRGSGTQARYVELETASTLSRPAVEDLYDAALAQNGVPFARTGKGSVTVRSTAAKKRRS